MRKLRPAFLALGVAVSVALVLGGAVFASAYYVAGLFTRPPWLEHRTPEQGLVSREGDPWAEKYWQGAIHDPGRDLGLHYEEVEFETEDESTLRGWYVPTAVPARTGVVTVHGGGGDRRAYLSRVPLFREAGYPVLLFDLREHGVSDGAGRGLSLGVREHADVIAAVRYLKSQRGIEQVAVVGESMGAVSALLAAGLSSELDAVVAEFPGAEIGTWVPFMLQGQMAASIADQYAQKGEAAPRWLAGSDLPSWWTDLVVLMTRRRIGAHSFEGPIDVVDRIAPRPLLLLHGDQDIMAPVEASRRLYARAHDPKELWIVPGGHHGLLYNDHPDEWRTRVLGFLARHLAAPPAD